MTARSLTSTRIRLNPQYALAYNNRGVAYNGKGSYDRALLDLDEAIRLNPKLTNAYAARGWAYTGKGSYDRAIADLDEAIRLDPKYAKAYNRRGLAYSSKGEHGRAIVDFDEAIRLDPKLALAYNGRGFVYASKRDYPRAIADYDQALILDPSLAVARQNRQLAQTAINPWQKLERPVTQGKAVLYEEDQAKLNGTQFVASAVWRTEGVAPGPGQQPGVVLRAEVEIPELKVRVHIALRRNDDKRLAASHTVAVAFTLPPDFPHGGISNITGILMKRGETTRGEPLNGIAVKVATNFFLIGLSSVSTDMQRNIRLLKDRSWLDIPVVFSDGRRAIISVEKGIPGERAFTEAFAMWGQ